MSDNAHDSFTRRLFLKSSGGWCTGLWIATHWPAMVAAHQQEEEAGGAPRVKFFTPAQASDMDALSAQILPSGATPGAREAHVLHFIDRSLATYFAGLAHEFRTGLADFQRGFLAAHPDAGSFAAADPLRQEAYLHTVEDSAFFDTARLLTILGMFSSPRYGGNFQAAGWKLLGFVDQHGFAPPFGHYDRDYAGFVPYPAKHT